MRKYEQEYAIRKTTELVKSESAFRRDVDLRLHALEERDRIIDTAAREVVDRAIRYVELELAPSAALAKALLADLQQGLPAALVTEEEDGRQFLTPERRADILATVLAELRGGVAADYDTLAKIVGLVGTRATQAGVTEALNSLQKSTATLLAEKAPQSHTHTKNQVTDLGAAAEKDVATAGAIRANNGADVITTDQAWDAAGWVDLGNITGSVTIDCSLGQHFYGVLGGNVTISTTNRKPGQPLFVQLNQDATGGRTVGWNSSQFFFPNNKAPTVNTTASQVAVLLSAIANSGASWWAIGWSVS